MDRDIALFEGHRGRLFGLAYRMLGTPADAEDVLHDAWLRLQAQDIAALDARPSRTSYTRAVEIRTGINRKRQINLFDPDGTRVELMEPHSVDGKPAPSSTLPPPR